MKSIITRNQFRKNFLKEVIMRLDFQSILQTELEAVLSSVKHYLKTKSFTRQGTLTDKTNSQIIYSFMDETSGYTIKLSNTYVILRVNTASYSPFEIYSEIFYDIVSIIKQNVDLFTIKRFGFRKINFCFVKKLENINKFFEPKYYSIEEPIDNIDINIINRTSKLFIDNKNINIYCVIEHGEIEQETCFKVILDSDIYSKDEKFIQSIFENKEEISKINDILFAIYQDAITEYFAKILLSEENNIPEELLGVEYND